MFNYSNLGIMTVMEETESNICCQEKRREKISVDVEARDRIRCFLT